MNRAKIFIVFIFLLAFAVCVSAQQYSYPNELRGFELFKKGKWQTLIPYVSNKDDVRKIFGEDCEKECDYDENWRIVVMYINQSWGGSEKGVIPCVAQEFLGKFESIIFYPKKRVVRNKLRFGKAFSKTRIRGSHSIPSTSNVYGDSNGLLYEISTENTEDARYKKGDLVMIRYGHSDEDYEKYKDKVFC